jgi:hypothetical protein
MKIERCITIFERQADPLYAEHAISGSDFEKLKKLVAYMDDDPNY